MSKYNVQNVYQVQKNSGIGFLKWKFQTNFLDFKFHDSSISVLSCFRCPQWISSYTRWATVNGHTTSWYITLPRGRKGDRLSIGSDCVCGKTSETLEILDTCSSKYLLPANFYHINHQCWDRRSSLTAAKAPLIVNILLIKCILPRVGFVSSFMNLIYLYLVLAPWRWV